MPILNTHRRRFSASIDDLGALLDTLGTPGDRIWPGHRWPAMRIERRAPTLSPGDRGSHGPVHYVVEEVVPLRRVKFRFTRPVGFVGTHTFDVLPDGDGSILEHRIEMTLQGLSLLLWPLAFRSLHDALAEDAGAKTARSLGEAVEDPPFSAYVRLLRSLF